MLTGGMLLVTFIASLLVLFALILWAKCDAFLALLLVAIGTGIVVGIPLQDIPGVITKGFGNTMAGVGILVALGIILGQLMEHSGAIAKIAGTMVAFFGPKRTPAALSGTGLVVGIPLFFDAAFVILNGITKRLSTRTGVPYPHLVLALSVGLITAYCIVIPTPAPMVVAENMQVDFGLFFLYGLLIAAIGVGMASLVYGPFITRKMAAYELTDEEKQETLEQELNEDKGISAGLSFLVILLPIMLIILGTVAKIMFPGTVMAIFLGFLGEKNIALLISVIFAIFALRPYMKVPQSEAFMDAFKASGMILLITGAGGSFGNVINSAGIGDYLIGTMRELNMPILLLSFVFAQTLRLALGSSTVSLVTTSSILGPVAASLGVSPLLVSLAICCGGIGLSMPNDSGFWVVSRFAGMSVKETVKTWSVGGFVAGVSGLIVVYILSLFSNILPGL